MERLDHYAVKALPVAGKAPDGPLASLGDAFVSRFHSWHGASGRRYVMSVFAADPSCSGFDLPEFEACVLVSVAREERTRRVIGVCVIERGSDRRRALAQAAGVDEWHVHFLAADRRDRAAVAADLSAHYGEDRLALSA